MGEVLSQAGQWHNCVLMVWGLPSAAAVVAPGPRPRAPCPVPLVLQLKVL